jgi:hypothetical protein
MSHEREADGNHGAAWMTGIVAAVVLYILSPVPVLSACTSGGKRDAPEWFLWVYAPVLYVSDRCKPVESFYEAYRDFVMKP